MRRPYHGRCVAGSVVYNFGGSVANLKIFKIISLMERALIFQSNLYYNYTPEACCEMQTLKVTYCAATDEKSLMTLDDRDRSERICNYTVASNEFCSVGARAPGARFWRSRSKNHLPLGLQKRTDKVFATACHSNSNQCFNKRDSPGHRRPS